MGDLGGSLTRRLECNAGLSQSDDCGNFDFALNTGFGDTRAGG